MKEIHRRTSVVGAFLRRVAQRNPVLRPRSRPRKDCGLGRRLQQPTPAFLAAYLPDTCGLRRNLTATHDRLRNPRPAPSARCSSRAERRNMRRDRMKLQSQVSTTRVNEG
jgi:hypothetical protein